MKLTVVSPERVIFKGQAVSVTVPGVKGAFEVLDNHAPIISALQRGKMVYKTTADNELQIAGGFINVANNEVAVCVETEV